MASGGGESSENNQYIPPNEDETTVYQNTEGIVMLFMVWRRQCETQRTKEHRFFFMRLLMTGNDSKRNFDSSESALINALIWNLVYSFQVYQVSG